MKSFKHWSAGQWAQLHNAIKASADNQFNRDLVMAIVEGSGVIEPSLYNEVCNEVSPWPHIISAYVNVSEMSPDEAHVFLGQMKKYVPLADDAKLALSVLIDMICRSTKMSNVGEHNWNELRHTLGLTRAVGVQDDMGAWSLD